ncbi:TVA4 protein, partial [Rhinopomastus cyanomelas]|nr:TVA4 protein [Rhinopomastus cyanomelas]
FSSAAAVVRAQVQQEPSVETPEGTAVSISCSHPNMRSAEYVQWYRQFPGRGPERLEFIHKGFKELRDPPGRLSVAEDRRSSSLWLQHPRLSDAATYYCARG